MQLSDFKLTPGQMVQLQVADEGQARKGNASLVGMIKGRFLLLTPFNVGVTLRRGVKVVGRIPLADGFCQFTSSIVQVVKEPVAMVILHYPAEVTHQKVRVSERVDVALPVSVINHSALEEAQAEGSVVDLGTCGMKLAVQEALASVGDQLTLTFRLAIGQVERQCEFKGAVRSRVERSSREVEQGLPAVYGIEFLELTDDDRILLSAYVYRLLAAVTAG